MSRPSLAKRQRRERRKVAREKAKGKAASESRRQEHKQRAARLDRALAVVRNGGSLEDAMNNWHGHQR